MNTLKSYILLNKGKGFFVMIGSLGCAIVSLCLYIRYGLTEFNPNYSVWTITAWSVGIGLGALSLAVTVRPVVFVQFLLYLYAMIQFIGSQANYLANIIYNVDGSTLSASFILTVLFSLLTFAAAAVAFALMKKRDEGETFGKEQEGMSV